MPKLIYRENTEENTEERAHFADSLISSNQIVTRLSINIPYIVFMKDLFEPTDGQIGPIISLLAQIFTYMFNLIQKSINVDL